MAKHIIITGAGSGIGRAVARAFLDAGWQVGLVGRRRGALEETANGHPAALILPCNVGDAAAVAQVFQTAHSAWGHLDVLFNNAGIFTPTATIDEVSLEDWTRCLNANLVGSFLCARGFWLDARAKPARRADHQ